jgi:hypothetical protein
MRLLFLNCVRVVLSTLHNLKCGLVLVKDIRDKKDFKDMMNNYTIRNLLKNFFVLEFSQIVQKNFFVLICVNSWTKKFAEIFINLTLCELCVFVGNIHS